MFARQSADRTETGGRKFRKHDVEVRERACAQPAHGTEDMPMHGRHIAINPISGKQRPKPGAPRGGSRITSSAVDDETTGRKQSLPRAQKGAEGTGE